MKRVIVAAKLIDQDIEEMMGQDTYNRLYDEACDKVRREIINEYGNVKITITYCEATAQTKPDGLYQMGYQIYAEFTTARGRIKNCYGEVSYTYDSKDSSASSPQLVVFDDEIEYE